MAPLNYLTSAGKRAQDVLPLTWLTLGIAILTCLIFVALVLLGLRRARTDTAADTAATPVERGGQGIVWITRSLLLAAIPLAIVLVWTMIAIAQMDMPPAAGLSLDITARQWWWDVRYDDAAPDRIFRTANEIHIPVSVPVLVRLKSSDVIHSFWVPQLEASKNGRFGSEVG